MADKTQKVPENVPGNDLVCGRHLHAVPRLPRTRRPSC